MLCVCVCAVCLQVISNSALLYHLRIFNLSCCSLSAACHRVNKIKVNRNVAKQSSKNRLAWKRRENY